MTAPSPREPTPCTLGRRAGGRANPPLEGETVARAARERSGRERETPPCGTRASRLFALARRLRAALRWGDRSPWRWPAAGTIVLVLMSSCGTRTLDPADPAGDAGAGTSETADGAVGARGPPAAHAAGPAQTVPAGSENGWTPNATVERVVDGDTIVVLIGGHQETVRLIGIDTPESVAPTRPVQCFGKEASLHLEAVLPAGTEITLVRDVEARDAYQRLLGYVVRSSDGLFVNLELVAAGYAAVLNYPPNDHYADVLDRAEADAVAAGRGLWGQCGGPDVPLE